MQALGQAAATPMIVLILPGAARAVTPSGPTCAVLLSTQAAMKALQEAAADLAGQYRVRFESTAGEAVEPPKVEVRRKGVKSRVGRTQLEVLKID